MNPGPFADLAQLEATQEGWVLLKAKASTLSQNLDIAMEKIEEFQGDLWTAALERKNLRAQLHAGGIREALLRIDLARCRAELAVARAQLGDALRALAATVGGRLK